MPSIDSNFLNRLEDTISSYPTFIETGTHSGDTIFAVESCFTKLYTIEFSEHYYNSTKNKYNGDKISFILGDSSIEFQTLLPTIKDNSVFFLDGHWSGGDTGRSLKDCPLEEEIIHINNLFTHNAIIIIDDYRLFGTILHEDWSNINKNKLLKILEKRIKKVYHLDSDISKDDRLIIHINSLSGSNT